jgi:nucleotide-binding universal stress UspA family protein
MPNQSEDLGVMVGVDGSAASNAAVRWAARWAAIRNIGLTIVHASAPVVPETSLVEWTGPAPSEVMRAQEEQARHLIDEAAKTADDTVGGLRIQVKAIATAAVPALLELSDDAQILVVGRRGRSSLAGVLLGSVSTAMIHHARCPVAVIHDESPGEAASMDAPVVVGIDGSPASELATAIAFDEASRRGVELVALHAAYDTDPFGIHELEWGYLEPKAHEALAKCLAGWQERYPDVRVRRVVVFDRPAHHLVEQAETAQLVVVGSRGRGGFSELLLGSVSAAVVQATRTPVIVARSRTAPQ